MAEIVKAAIIKEYEERGIMEPIIFAGVNRKVNIGNFETIDVYAGTAMPASLAAELSEELAQTLAKAVDNGFAFASKETYKRYDAIKSAQGS